MRLRLLVRRNGLPEARLMWDVQLENSPTIANLLEQLNEDVPLEGGQWGLEDYVVELHDDDGTSFECLHYQPVCNVLKPDDRVFIRALDRGDTRRRRISGRHQISSDGRHLIDGVPFGRPRLRVPTGRPPVYIPPRKRPRLTREDDDSDTPMLLLTEGDNARQDSPHVRFGIESDVADSEDGDFEGDLDTTDLTTSDEEDYDDESESTCYDVDGSESPRKGNIAQELRELEEENAAFDKGQELPEEPSENQTLDLAALDKLSALQAAFPTAPIDICEKVLMACGGDLKTTYGHLLDGFMPKLSETAVLAWPQANGHSEPDNTAADGVSGSGRSISKGAKRSIEEVGIPDETESEGNNEDTIPAFVLQYDYRGLPPGSITSGKGLAQMAAIAAREQDGKRSTKGGDAAIPHNDNPSSKRTVEETDDTTSSSGTSSSSESEGSKNDSNDDDASSSDSDSDSESDTSSINSRDSDARSGPGDSVDHESSDSSSGSGSDETSDGDDSGPEEISFGKPQASTSSRSLATLNRNPSLDDSSEEDDSSSSSDSSGDASSEAQLSSEANNGNITSRTGSMANPASKSQVRGDGLINPTPETFPGQPTPSITVPPGAGKESTKSRNARRRAANKAKKLAQQNVTTSSTTTRKEDAKSASSMAKENEYSLFEARRKALLDAIANGGIEVGPGSQLAASDSGTVGTGSKRRREDQADLQNQRQSEPDDNTPQGTTLDEEPSPGSAQKRRRIDVGAGRRLLFGALGLSNPKSKKDEDTIRTKLMEGVRPLVNSRLMEGNINASQLEQMSQPVVEEDPDAWRTKITYRAVECCQEGIELSEPPFPFAQRWDPQQQGLWYSNKNKRGGRNKRTQRNQAHYYEENTRLGKRKHDESEYWEGEGYDVTFNGFEDTRNEDIQLNYDDEDPDDQAMKEDVNASQTTELDDLPPVPLDPSVLPTLRLGEAQVGMVVTWQKWSCSSATNWQPQISNVSAVVTGIGEDAGELEVCLAKRDRHLDGNQKRYDPYTGQRVYDRFEAPDLDEDNDDAEGDDGGFRTFNFSEMQDPRILQQPLDAADDAVVVKSIQSSVAISLEERERQDPATSPKASQGQIAHSAKIPNPGILSRTNDENISPIRPIEEPSTANGPDSQATSRTTSHQPGQGQQATKLSMSGFSNPGSPSLQLQETSSQAISAISQERYTLESKGTKANTGGETGGSARDTSDADATSARNLSPPIFAMEDETDVLVGTPKVVHHRLAAPSVASSVQSGRQPDYSIAVDEEPASFRATEDGISTILGENRSSIGPEDSPTSTPLPAPEAVTPNSERAKNKDFAMHSSPINPSTPGSLASLNTIWCTAATSRHTQSPSKSQALSAEPSQSSRALKNLAYEDAMRKLDELSDDAQDSSWKIADQSLDLKSRDRGDGGGSLNDEDKDEPIIKASPHSPQPLTTSRISPPPRRRKSTRPSSQFSLPPGAQVLDLSSDSDSVIPETYADDKIDGTYSPNSEGLPKGGGWVKKRGARHLKSRSSTAPLGSQPKGKRYLSASQGHTSISPVNPIPDSIRQKSRKKLSARF